MVPLALKRVVGMLHVMYSFVSLHVHLLATVITGTNNAQCI
jgi:hypothetical protein